MSNESKKVMVIGGGIAGLTAAWELAGLGAQVALVEKADFLGGHAIQYACKATDECRQCGACAVESMLKNVVNEPAITVHLATQVADINKNGNFKISLKKTDVAKDLKACDAGYTANPTGCAAVRGYSLNNAKYYLADGSLNPETTGNADTLEVEAVVVATGFIPFDPRIKSTYRYDDLDNVVSGMDLESGKRANGTVLRPSDGKPPKKIAFIQCVGSRDERLGNLWCSQVCCPYALRTAQAMKHKDPELDITIFYMDIQNTGNDFPVFFQKCKDEMKFVRNIPVDMYKSEDDRIRTRFMAAEGGSEAVEDEFDMVVLSVGIMPAADNASLSELVGAPLNGDGFFACADKLNRALTGQDGIFVAGTASGPKTIAESIVHAGQSAGEVIKYLGRAS
ncbi:MAG: CoB--CoM heterodisulfide reductase iron-sulfur subunit A family protein [Desulfosarcina sp.]|nr:CoB--CoM heterodisulfide reductase iron-sulfur subunit A family protein [Desulfosarcina sp.]MBC2743431.1 CoB--CoM heterodisulfide reductase iron-sulfur subunit A family protein [Desulfosarcina sp.]MBC2766341.1 CoB--CoM heterodisulfide reductase iron-sulfur subunit A family protein [Desulfosarcina sp.]